MRETLSSVHRGCGRSQGAQGAGRGPGQPQGVREMLLLGEVKCESSWSCTGKEGQGESCSKRGCGGSVVCAETGCTGSTAPTENCGSLSDVTVGGGALCVGRAAGYQAEARPLAHAKQWICDFEKSSQTWGKGSEGLRLTRVQNGQAAGVSKGRTRQVFGRWRGRDCWW